MNENRPLRLAVVGAEHLHLFQIVDALVRAGAETVAHTPGGSYTEMYSAWRTESVERSAEAILADDDIDVVVTVAVPDERAAVTVCALRADKAVVSAKPGVTSRSQLGEVVAALDGTVGRAWTVLFTERFENRATSEAIRMATNGAVGRIVRVHGAGPHTLAGPDRPEWFWDPVRSGGILADFASHQIDQFLALVDDPDTVRVRAAAVGNVATPDHPQFQDVGSLTLVAPGVQGEHVVDLLSPAGLGTWGDVRLSVVGTEGTLEVRANIDVCGEEGGEHLIWVDADGARRVDVSQVALNWAELLVADLADDGQRLMSQRHVVRVCDLALQAQEMAEPWGGVDA